MYIIQHMKKTKLKYLLMAAAFIMIFYIGQAGSLFISHWDDDHYSGLEDILNSPIRVNTLFSSRSNDSFQVQEVYSGCNSKQIILVIL
jgi:metal-dependent hydrolase (beta-lactamase superfamily II)